MMLMFFIYSLLMVLRGCGLSVWLRMYRCRLLIGWLIGICVGLLLVYLWLDMLMVVLVGLYRLISCMVLLNSWWKCVICNGVRVLLL